MAISSTAPVLTETFGNQDRRLLLRNGELERFEVQHSPFGVFQLFDQLFGRGPAPQVRHVRDIVALGLVGGGMGDRLADALIAGLPPSENMRLREVAQRLLGVTFIPSVLDEAAGKKRKAGSRAGEASQPSPTTAPESGLPISSEPSPD